MNRDTKNNYSVFDTHCDTLCCVRDDGKSLNENDCHVDLKSRNIKAIRKFLLAL